MHAGIWGPRLKHARAVYALLAETRADERERIAEALDDWGRTELVAEDREAVEAFVRGLWK